MGADTTDDVSGLLARYDEWRDERADLSAAEGSTPHPDPDDWADSDDEGCALAEELAGALRRVLGIDTEATS